MDFPSMDDILDEAENEIRFKVTCDPVLEAPGELTPELPIERSAYDEESECLDDPTIPSSVMNNGTPIESLLDLDEEVPLHEVLDFEEEPPDLLCRETLPQMESCVDAKSALPPKKPLFAHCEPTQLNNLDDEYNSALEYLGIGEDKIQLFDSIQTADLDIEIKKTYEVERTERLIPLRRSADIDFHIFETVNETSDINEFVKSLVATIFDELFKQDQENLAPQGQQEIIESKPAPLLMKHEVESWQTECPLEAVKERKKKKKKDASNNEPVSISSLNPIEAAELLTEEFCSHETVFEEQVAEENAEVIGKTSTSIPENIEDANEATFQEELQNSNAETALEIAEVANSPKHALEPTRNRFDDNVIAVVHDMGEDTNIDLLTESEMQLGKTKPYWIPDVECPACMLCTTRFSLLLRRHHCRACGRVLCAACCSERTTLEYLGDDEKKNKQRVCAPCKNILERIKERQDASQTCDNVTPRGVLKSRSVVATENGNSDDPGPSNSQPSSNLTEFSDRKRSVVFRDGVRPGETAESEATDGAPPKPPRKKPSRKRIHVTQKLAAMRIDEEIQSVLPESIEGPYIIRSPDGSLTQADCASIVERLCDFSTVEIFIKRNVSCVIQYLKHPLKQEITLCSISSRGFAAVGLDEIVFIWEAEQLENKTFNIILPSSGLSRVSEMFESCFQMQGNGVKTASARMPRLHSATLEQALPFTTSVIVFRPAPRDMKLLKIQCPREAFVVGIFIHNDELPWALAHPNRLLLRLGLEFCWFPCPLINPFERKPVYCHDPSRTILTVFTDFKEWSYRLQTVPGCTITMRNTDTIIKLPRVSRDVVRAIVTSNKRLIGLLAASLEDDTDSTLVCIETENKFGTQVFSRNNDRKAAAASFAIVDSGLEKADVAFQVKLIEDGISIRLGIDDFDAFVEALLAGTDFERTCKSGSALRIIWGESGIHAKAPDSFLVSPIDGTFLGDQLQYGISLARVFSTASQVFSNPQYRIRLSHVFHLGIDRLTPDEEPKFFTVAEMLYREAAQRIDNFVGDLYNMDIRTVALRALISEAEVALDIGHWEGLEDEHAKYVSLMDQIVPILYNLLEYVPNGVHFELHMSFVFAKDFMSP